MSVADVSRCRLCLVTPVGYDAPNLALLADALSGGDVASLIITAPADPSLLQQAAELLVPIAQARGTAALITNDIQIAGRTDADGVHAEGGPAQLAAIVNALRGRKIVGAGNIRTRHDAMLAGEAEPDYLFFGRLDGDRGDLIFEKALDLASWWADMAFIPAVIMGGRSIASVRQAVEARIEFVALCRAVFEHSAGAAAAVAEANRLLGAVMEPAT